MKRSSWHRWWQPVPRGGSIDRAWHGGRWTPRLEALEDRTVPSGTPHMVLDISTTTRTSDPQGIVAVGPTAYFVADDGIHGKELWKSDGTAAGTTLVKDIYPGTYLRYGVSVPVGSRPDNLTDVNGALFFDADDGVHGRSLWKSDGTAAGTVLVKDVGADGLTNVNGTLFFATSAGLWESDGTTAGTALVKGVGASELTDVNGTLFFVGYDPVHDGELWKSDGTAAGTVIVKDINHGSAGSNPFGLTNFNGTLVFEANDGVHGFELWKSDGTDPGTVLVKDINPGGPNNSSRPGGFVAVNGTLFFGASDGATDGLWKTDGTADGTVLVKGVGASELTNVNGTLFFRGDDGTTAGLWKSDGTAAGTTTVVNLFLGFVPGGRGYLTNVGGTLFFVADESVHGSEVWKSDGTAAGTVLVRDVNPTGASYPVALTDVDGTLFFGAADGPAHGRELWKSDGTAAGTALIKDINSTAGDSVSDGFADLNGVLYFPADDGTGGTELWESDGTAAGTALVKEIFPGGHQAGFFGQSTVPNSSYPTSLTNVNGTLFFAATDAAHGAELWKSDGTAAGTALVKDIWPASVGTGYPYGNSYPSNLTNVNGTLFFTANDGTHGTELWKSDGTDAGTVMVKDINAGASSSPRGLTVVNATLYFAANDGAHGYELWKSDGTAAGTVLVRDINPGTAGANPGSAYFDSLLNVNGTLYFAADDGTHGAELWRSDGTAAGTTIVADARPGPAGSSPAHLTTVNGTLFFTANDGTAVGLWKSDGTAAGTTLLRDIYTGSTNYNYRVAVAYLTTVNGTLFFSANDVTHGKELWRSDGTPGGTGLVRDTNSGSAGSNAGSLTNVGGTLYFRADDGVHGLELWQSDGTAAGTAMVADINPGARASNPFGLTNLNGTLYFSATDGLHGQQLWSLPPATPPTVAGVRVNDGSNQRSEVKSITVTFSTSVTFAGGNAAAAFQLTHLADGVSVALAAAVSTDYLGDTVVTLTFAGPETDPISGLNGGPASLADGRYSLIALSAEVNADGQALAGGGPNGDWVSPADAYGGHGLHLYRLFGDVNGDGVVDAIDLGQLRSTFNRNHTDPLYLWCLDADNGGVVDAGDLGQFRTRFNSNVF
jgi:ELWxxDGT repeat protein